MSGLCHLARGASTLAKTGHVVASRALATTAANASKGTKMNDPYEHATGIEKYELAALHQGNDDPFYMRASRRGKGTRDEPNIVTSFDTYRYMGCVCNEHATHVKWMVLYEDHPKRCYCGHWFKLNKVPAIEKYSMPKNAA